MHSSKICAALRNATVLIVLAGASGIASAAPYSITYTGTISSSTFPEVNNGEQYTATLVFDNGGASAASQTWGAADLTCAIWTANDAADVSAAFDLVASVPSAGGSVSTDAGGALTANFASVTDSPVIAGTYTSSGIALTDPLDWFMNDINDVFYSDTQSVAWGDAAGGVQMAIGNWTNPVPFAGGCAALAPPTAAPVPTMPLWLLAAMAGLLSWAGVRKLRSA